jgi:hypothetical protein
MRTLAVALVLALALPASIAEAQHGHGGGGGGGGGGGWHGGGGGGHGGGGWHGGGGGWHGGGWHGGSGWYGGVYLGAPWPYYDYGPGYYSGYDYDYPPDYDGAAPADVGPHGVVSWYYCPDSKSYYPYVQSCPSGWQALPPTPQGAPPN